MKSLPGAASKRTTASLKKRSPKPVPHEIRWIAHQLLNHLTVINLCSSTLRSQLAAISAGTLSENAASLERAVQEATVYAEFLAQVMAESTDTGPKNSAMADPTKPNRNVVPLFKGPR